MVQNWIRSCLAACAACAALPLVSIAQEEPQATPGLPVQIVGQITGGAAPAFVFAEEAPAGEYWIGIALGELPDVAKKQLGLEHGLVVGEAIADSPAAKAGFEQHDILLKVGDQQLKEGMDLVKAVEGAKESELSITLLRGGKEQTLKVTPMKRPQPAEYEARIIETPASQSANLNVEIKRLHEALQKLQSKAAPADDHLRFFFARPAVVAHADVLKSADFPKDMSIEIRKEGSQPAKIHVKQGDKEWNLDEGKPTEWPAEVRAHVHGLLSGVAGLDPHAIVRMHATAPKVHALRVKPDGKIEGEIHVTPVPAPLGVPGVRLPTLAPPIPAPSSAHPPTASVEAKLDAILKRLEEQQSKSIEQLQNEVKQLRQDLDAVREKK